MSQTVLYDYWRSSASYRVRIALHHLGIEYETVPVNLLEGEHRDEAYLDVNPQGLIPTLVIDGRTFTQSLAIIEYLSELYPQARILPSDPLDRQQVRSLAYTVAMDIHPICNPLVANHVVEITGDTASKEAWMRRFIPSGFSALERMLAATTGKFSFGDSPTMADFCLVPQVYNARRWNIDMSAYPRMAAIDAACCALPAFHAAHPDQAAT